MRVRGFAPLTVAAAVAALLLAVGCATHHSAGTPAGADRIETGGTPPTGEPVEPSGDPGQDSAAAAIRAYLAANFAQQDWYRHVATVRTAAGAAWVHTDLGVPGQQQAMEICATVGGFLLANRTEYHVDQLMVRGVDGTTLARQRALGQPCR
ncbi:MAG: hypothetical protein ACJ73S_14745 [Mycobacteriales bacterium]|jgi:hypothetical protein